MVRVFVWSGDDRFFCGVLPSNMGYFSRGFPHYSRLEKVVVEFVADGLREVIAGLDAFGKRVYRRAAADGLTTAAFEIKRDEVA